MFRHLRSVIRGDGGRKTKKEVTEDDGMLLWAECCIIHTPATWPSRGSIFSGAEWMCLYSLLTSRRKYTYTSSTMINAICLYCLLQYLTSLTIDIYLWNPFQY